MAPRAHNLDPHARSLEKQSSRAADERALRAGGGAAREAKDRNEAFASVAKLARANVSRARSLS